MTSRVGSFSSYTRILTGIRKNNYSAVRAQDFPLMQGLFLTITVAVLAANWLVDVVTIVLDPRMRT